MLRCREKFREATEQGPADDDVVRREEEQGGRLATWADALHLACSLVMIWPALSLFGLGDGMGWDANPALFC